MDANKLNTNVNRKRQIFQLRATYCSVLQLSKLRERQILLNFVESFEPDLSHTREYGLEMIPIESPCELVFDYVWLKKFYFRVVFTKLISMF